MAASLSIKNVPDAMLERLRERARRNHRSLQGELLSILEAALGPGSPALTPSELLAEVRGEGVATPDEASAWLREDRDRR